MQLQIPCQGGIQGQSNQYPALSFGTLYLLPHQQSQLKLLSPRAKRDTGRQHMGMRTREASQTFKSHWVFWLIE